MQPLPQPKKIFENVQIWKHPVNEFRDCQTCVGRQKFKMTVLPFLGGASAYTRR